MPLFLLPPPRRIRITRRNFALPERNTLRVEPHVAASALGAVARLAALFPGLSATDARDEAPAIRLLPRAGAPELSPLPELAVPATPGEQFAIEVSEEGILLAADAAPSFQYGAELIAQLMADGEVVGARIEDWPVFPTRELSLPGSVAEITPEFGQRLLENLSVARFNRLTFAEAGEADEALARHAVALGIEIATREPDGDGPEAASLLLPEPGVPGAGMESALEALREVALAAAAEGKREWRVRVASPAAGTPLDAFWFAIAFAGGCGWHPAKSDLKLYRRAFALRFFGPETDGAREALDVIEAAASVEGVPVETLFREDPAAPHALRRLARGPERLREARDNARAAVALIETAHATAARNAEAVTALAGPARRLLAQSQALIALQDARETYAEARAAAGSPRAVSTRLVRAAEALETAANQIQPLQTLFTDRHAAERKSPLPPDAWTLYADRIDRLRQLARSLREARDTYIQTGALPAPDAVGLTVLSGPDTGARHPGRAAPPVRLPSPHSPAWWPEGGEARARIEVAKGNPPFLPWEIAVDLRAWAGDEGAFHLGQMRLLAYDDTTDEIGPELPCQQTRSGFVALLSPRRTYYLYLDRRGGTGHEPSASVIEGASRVRARQSATAVGVEGALGRARVERTRGLLDDWSWSEVEGGSALEIAVAMGETSATREAAARVRVVENGPLLVRVQVDDADGRVRQYDFYAGESGWEWATSTPLPDVANRLRPEPWAEATALFPGETGVVAGPIAGAEGTGDWAARLRPDGLALAALCPEGAARHHLDRDRHDVSVDRGLTRVAWRLLRTDATPTAPDPLGQQLDALVAALRRSPTVQLGPIEERRAREF